MTRLTSKFSCIICIYLIATLQISCSTDCKNENNAHISPILDTLNYGKKDYDLMRAYFSSDTLTLSNLKKEIEAGNTDAIKLNKLLTSEYELRHKTGVTEPEIKALMFSYYTLKGRMDEFLEIESGLRKAGGGSDPDAIRKKTDSLINTIEKLKQEMEEQVKEH